MCFNVKSSRWVELQTSNRNQSMSNRCFQFPKTWDLLPRLCICKIYLCHSINRQVWLRSFIDEMLDAISLALGNMPPLINSRLVPAIFWHVWVLFQKSISICQPCLDNIVYLMHLKFIILLSNGFEPENKSDVNRHLASSSHTSPKVSARSSYQEFRRAPIEGKWYFKFIRVFTSVYGAAFLPGFLRLLTCRFLCWTLRASLGFTRSQKIFCSPLHLS